MLPHYLSDNLTGSPPLTLYFHDIYGRDKIKSFMMNWCFILRYLLGIRPYCWVSYFSLLFSYSFTHNALSFIWEFCFRVKMILTWRYCCSWRILRHKTALTSLPVSIFDFENSSPCTSIGALIKFPAPCSA